MFKFYFQKRTWVVHIKSYIKFKNNIPTCNSFYLNEVHITITVWMQNKHNRLTKHWQGWTWDPRGKPLKNHWLRWWNSECPLSLKGVCQRSSLDTFHQGFLCNRNLIKYQLLSAQETEFMPALGFNVWV